MTTDWTAFMRICKTPFFAAVIISLAACSTNPATGARQFTGLMSPGQESSVGASEHQKVEQQFGFYNDPKLTAYVNEVGNKVTKDTERADVQYKFYVIDSPIVNAFALPGGYIYVSRGLLALANSEAELAAVLSHETGHITARHSAERYSHGVVTSLGAAVLGAAVGSDGVSQALGVGSNLYLSSYSRGQENEADMLGLRYMTRGGYEPSAMSSFLKSLQNDTSLESRMQGGDGGDSTSYFSTHPATAERVSSTLSQAANYPKGGAVNHDRHLQMIENMIYGDSEKQGFVRGNSFFHPGLGFAFNVPEGFTIENQPSQVVAVSKNGAAIIFDLANDAGDPMIYLTQNWMKNEAVEKPENISISGMPAATAGFAGNLNGKPVTIRLVAIRFGNKMARFQVAIPQGANASLVNALKTSTYSFRPLNESERQAVRPYRVYSIMAGNSDTVSTMAQRMPEGALREERFRVLNGLGSGEGVKAGQKYKVIGN
ncbi:MAG: M48 family metalloprotease [Micavibrio sp.]|nr:M48 family metalloprotease [Micavibrio sp.]